MFEKTMGYYDLEFSTKAKSRAMTSSASWSTVLWKTGGRDHLETSMRADANNLVLQASSKMVREKRKEIATIGSTRAIAAEAMTVALPMTSTKRVKAKANLQAAVDHLIAKVAAKIMAPSHLRVAKVLVKDERW